MTSRKVPWIDFIAGKQEEECHAKFGEQADSVRRVHYIECIWAENCSCDKQQDRFRNKFVGDAVGYKRNDGRYYGDNCQRNEIGVHASIISLRC